MSLITCWESIDDVKLYEVMTWAMHCCKADMMLVVERSNAGPKGRYLFDKSVESTVNSMFKYSMVKQLRVIGWPGTLVSASSERVTVVRLDEKLVKSVVSKEPWLFHWVHNSYKKLPEDICIFKEGGKYPLFSSITHEKQAYIVCDMEISIKGFHKVKSTPEELMLSWPGPFHCLLPH